MEMLVLARMFPNGARRTKIAQQCLYVWIIESWMGWEGIGQKGFTPPLNAYFLE